MPPPSHVSAYPIAPQAIISAMESSSSKDEARAPPSGDPPSRAEVRRLSMQVVRSSSPPLLRPLLHLAITLLMKSAVWPAIRKAIRKKLKKIIEWKKKNSIKIKLNKVLFKIKSLKKKKKNIYIYIYRIANHPLRLLTNDD